MDWWNGANASTILCKKINGERSYNLARKNIHVELKKQKIKIYNIRIVHHKGNKTSFFVTCGNGTYIRSLIRDIAYALHTFGYASKIIRYRYGQFSQKTSLNMDFIVKNMKKEELSKYLLEINKVSKVAKISRGVDVKSII